MNLSYKDFLTSSRYLDESERIEVFLNHILKVFQDNTKTIPETLDIQNKDSFEFLFPGCKENDDYFNHIVNEYLHNQSYHQQCDIYYQECKNDYQQTKYKILNDSKFRNRYIYSELTKFGLNVDTDFNLSQDGTMTAINIKENYFFKGWEQEFANKSNIRAYCDEENWPCFMQFKNGNLTPDEEFEKIYLSLDYEHLYDGAKMLFSMLNDENIVHLSKIANKIRTDNIVIRIKKTDKDSLHKILNFIDNNQYIKEGMNQLNPFLPNVNGVAHIEDHGESYNSGLATCIGNFVIENLNSKSLSAKQFLDYSYSIDNQSVRKTLLSHLEPVVQQTETDCLDQAILCTYENKGYGQVVRALIEAINNNNYNYFSRYRSEEMSNDNKTNYRERLMKSLKSKDILNLIAQKLSKDNYNVQKLTTEQLIQIYVSNMFVNQQISVLDQVVELTCKRHGSEWTEKAMNLFIDKGIARGFSRTNGENNLNYRKILYTYVNKDDLRRLITISMIKKGIDVSKINDYDLFNTYANYFKDQIIKSK